MKERDDFRVTDILIENIYYIENISFIIKKCSLVLNVEIYNKKFSRGGKIKVRISC